MTLGFIGVAGLTLVLFGYQAVLGFRRKRPQVGILRAGGMSAFQAARWLGLEYSSIGSMGILGGLAAGAIVSWLFLPLLEGAVGGPSAGPVFQVAVAWDLAWGFAAAMAAALVVGVVGSFVAVLRMRPHEAIQLADELS